MPISMRDGVEETLKYAERLLREGHEVTIIHGKKPGFFEVAGRKPLPPEPVVASGVRTTI